MEEHQKWLRKYQKIIGDLINELIMPKGIKLEFKKPTTKTVNVKFAQG